MTTNPNAYSGRHDPARWVLPAVLAEQAARQPDAPWFIGIGGEQMTFGSANADMRRAAGYFAALGVKRGDVVVLLAGSHADFVRAWLGLLCLGAIAVLLNTELRGAFLRHQLVDSAATLAVVDADLLPAVQAVAHEVPALARVAVIGASAQAWAQTLAEPISEPSAARPAQGPARLAWQGWRDSPPYDGEPPRWHDIACIMYTSGTSGPSKGVLMPHAHCTLFGIGSIESMQASSADRWYIALPLFHANGLLIQLGAPALEAMFRQRFGIADVVSGYGMTEVNMPIWGRIGHSAPGAAGWVHGQHFDLIIADPETDIEMPRGTMGEILIRPRVPFGFMAGYHQAAQKTVEAWRNLWFHSGDAGVMDETGLVTFVDRIKDCIRRRGENIAANEVESLLGALPFVAEIAAFAVPSDVLGGEDELMLAIVPNDGVKPSLAELGDAAERLLPRFARPRYLQLLAELPKTATGKVQRAVLRKAGSAAALDRGAGSRRGAEEA